MKTNDSLIRYVCVRIGKTTNDFFSAEIIFKEPKKVVEILLSKGYYVSLIRWWHRAKIADGSEIGHGGPRDPSEPLKYYFAEMDLEKTFSSTTTKEQYNAYIDDVKNTYSGFDLYPSLECKRGRQGDGSVVSK